jgi:hypothetical protein
MDKSLFSGEHGKITIPLSEFKAASAELTALRAQVAELEGALRAIKDEAERPNSLRHHLVRCIAAQYSQALKGNPDGTA